MIERFLLGLLFMFTFLIWGICIVGVISDFGLLGVAGVLAFFSGAALIGRFIQ